MADVTKVTITTVVLNDAETTVVQQALYIYERMTTQEISEAMGWGSFTEYHHTVNQEIAGVLHCDIGT